MAITDRVKELNLPFGKYIVIGSGILDALGLRTANDIDIAVLPELYEQLRATGEWEEEERYGKIFLMKEGVEINPRLEWEDFPTTTRQAIGSALVVDSIAFLNLEELKKFKRALGRQKDYNDIALIDRYLKGSI